MSLCKKSVNSNDPLLCMPTTPVLMDRRFEVGMVPGGSSTMVNLPTTFGGTSTFTLDNSLDSLVNSVLPKLNQNQQNRGDPRISEILENQRMLVQSLWFFVCIVLFNSWSIRLTHAVQIVQSSSKQLVLATVHLSLPLRCLKGILMTCIFKTSENLRIFLNHKLQLPTNFSPMKNCPTLNSETLGPQLLLVFCFENCSALMKWKVEIAEEFRKKKS